MSKITCVRRIQFCAGHRVLGHENKCSNIHGHNYVAFFHAAAPELDTLGRVMDFSVLKFLIGNWIETRWDHAFIFCEKDEVCKRLYHQAPKFESIKGMKYGPIHDLKHFCMPQNPTAENMALYLLQKVCPLVLSGTGITIEKVVLWETENCCAEAII